jgi:signal transduction histidine kinase/ActR/RegA family two-component response regulator
VAPAHDYSGNSQAQGDRPLRAALAFRSTSLLRVLLALSVLAPTLLFGVAAWRDRAHVLRAAENRAAKAADILHEHALTVFETQRLVIARVGDRIRGMGWKDIAASRDLHDFLVDLQRGLPQIESVFLTDPDGFIAASSRAFPMQPYDVRDREYFVGSRAGHRGMLVSAPFRGQMKGTWAFTISQARLGPAGEFDGVIAVTVSPDYFRAIFAKLTAGEGNSSIALVRTDGVVLVRYPGADRIPAGITPARPLMKDIAAGRHDGLDVRTSSWDGTLRLAAFRTIEGFPVIAKFGLDERAALRPWRISLLEYGSFALAMMAALVGITLLAIRNTSAEEATMARLRAEMVNRERIEAQLRQAQKIEAVGQFTSGVAHDFNNLLTGIIGNLELLQGSAGDERQRRRLTSAMRAAEQGAKLTQQLLAFSRKQHLDRQAVDLRVVLERARDMLKRMTGGMIDIETTIGRDLWRAFADPGQLEVAIVNLALNARDAMPGGGALSIAAENCPMGMPSLPPELAPGDYVAIAVTDTGVGMSEEVKARAIEPFFTTKDVGKGSGLGLSQVYGFVQQSDGTVRIDSVPGRGTTVRIYLPRTMETRDAERDAGGATTAGESAPGVRILLVDDNDDVREVTAASLQSFGHSVVEAASGAAALALLDGGETFDLLIADYAMPGMNGRRLIEEAWRRRPALPAFLVTGYTDAAGLGQFERAVTTLKKPFKLRDLEEAVRKATEAAGNSAANTRYPAPP